MKKAYVYFYSFLLLILFSVTFFHPIKAINQDLGRQLLLGSIISSSHAVPGVNLLSYTYPNFQFVDTHWLFSVVAYQLTLLGGFDLLLIVSIFIIGYAFVSLIYYARKKYSLGSVLAATTIYLSLLGTRTDIRPEMFSMLFISIFLLSLLKFRDSGGIIKIIFLVPLEALWVNFHIYYIFGPLLVFLFIIDDYFLTNAKYITKRKNSLRKIHFSKKSRDLLYLLMGTMASTLVNPNGLRGAISPIFILPNYGIQVTENQGIFTLFRTYTFVNPSYIFDPLLGCIVIFVLFTLLFLGRKNSNPIDWLLAIIFSTATILVFRNVSLLIFATFVTFTAQLDFVIKKYKQSIKKYLFGSMWLETTICLVLIIVVILHSIIIRGFGFGLIEDNKSAVDFFQANQIGGPIYNNFNIGGYLAYRIYPEKVYIDNRPEAYPQFFTRDIYSKMQNNPQIFKNEDIKYNFNAIIMSYWDGLHGTYGLLSYFINNSNFIPVYLDQNTVILVRNSPANAFLINQKRITNSSININSINDPKILTHYLLFFQEVGWKEDAQIASSKLGTLKPQFNVFFDQD